MFKKPAIKIQVGDRFIKTDDPKTVWIVSGESRSVGTIPHYQVVREDYESRLRTLSGQVLLNTDYYRRVE